MENFSCPLCKNSPEIVVCDGLCLSFKKAYRILAGDDSVKPPGLSLLSLMAPSRSISHNCVFQYVNKTISRVQLPRSHRDNFIYYSYILSDFPTLKFVILIFRFYTCFVKEKSSRNSVQSICIYVMCTLEIRLESHRHEMCTKENSVKL